MNRADTGEFFSVAIDGPAGAGKSSIAKEVSNRLGFVHVDTGALYRSLALYMLENGISPEDLPGVREALPNIVVDVKYSPQGQQMFLNGRDVTSLIRTEEVSQAASAFSAIPAVRTFLLGLQRDIAKRADVLVDGRDIGTVVLPNATLKVFLTASPEVRAQRRVLQIISEGKPGDFSKTLKDIIRRDFQDSHRETAPLKQADDAVLLDTTYDTFEQSVEKMLSLIAQKRGEKEVKANAQENKI